MAAETPRRQPDRATGDARIAAPQGGTLDTGTSDALPTVRREKALPTGASLPTEGVQGTPKDVVSRISEATSADVVQALQAVNTDVARPGDSTGRRLDRTAVLNVAGRVVGSEGSAPIHETALTIFQKVDDGTIPPDERHGVDALIDMTGLSDNSIRRGLRMMGRMGIVHSEPDPSSRAGRQLYSFPTESTAGATDDDVSGDPTDSYILLKRLGEDIAGTQHGDTADKYRQKAAAHLVASALEKGTFAPTDPEEPDTYQSELFGGTIDTSVAATLYNRVASGVIKPGEVYGVTDLMANPEISNAGHLREGLDVLHAAGVVSFKPTVAGGGRSGYIFSDVNVVPREAQASEARKPTSTDELLTRLRKQGINNPAELAMIANVPRGVVDTFLQRGRPTGRADMQPGETIRFADNTQGQIVERGNERFVRIEVNGIPVIVPESKVRKR